MLLFSLGVFKKRELVMVFVALSDDSGKEITLNTDNVKILENFDYLGIEKENIDFEISKLNDPLVWDSPLLAGKTEEEAIQAIKEDQKNKLANFRNVKTTIHFMDGSREWVRETQEEIRQAVNDLLVLDSKPSEPKTLSKKGDLGKNFP